MKRAALVTGAALFLFSCSEPQPTGGDDDDTTPGEVVVPAPVVLLVGVTTLNPSELLLLAHLASREREIVIVDDDDLAKTPVDGAAVIVMSKTVNSVTVAGQLRDLPVSVLFWEDNQQMLSMMATIDNDGSGGTAWHSAADSVYVEPDAPVELRAGLSGTIGFYAQPDQITYAPADDQLATGAIRIARFAEGDHRWPIYAYETGSLLPDGTPAAGRRIYFGLYDDTFRLLTGEGTALFDAVVTWALESSSRSAPARSWN